MASSRLLPQTAGSAENTEQTVGRLGWAKMLQRLSRDKFTQRTPAALPSGMPGSGELMEGEMQQAPQPGRHCMERLLLEFGRHARARLLRHLCLCAKTNPPAQTGSPGRAWFIVVANPALRQATCPEARSRTKDCYAPGYGDPACAAPAQFVSPTKLKRTRSCAAAPSNLASQGGGAPRNTCCSSAITSAALPPSIFLIG
jgi:hypothetical protein